MIPSISTYGTTGLPYFGNEGVDFTGREAAIGEVSEAFNTLMATVKKYTVKGNEIPLHGFGIALEQAWSPALKAVAGLPVVNN